MNFTRICVVDDDPLIHFTFKKLITVAAWPCEVIPLYDGEQLYNYLLDNANNKDLLPHVILLDLNMPVLDGWEFLKKYERLKPELAKEIEIHIIASTPTEQDIMHAKLNPHVKTCIVKPVTRDKIEAIFK